MKTRNVLLLALGIFILYFSFCKLNPFLSSDDNFVFNYSAYDSTSVKVVRGWMKLKVDSKEEVTGEWIFEKIVKDAVTGPQNGAGKLTGQISDSVLFVNLNPDMVDNNVFLTAKWDEKKMTGMWQFVGFPGVINKGTFVASGN